MSPARVPQDLVEKLDSLVGAAAEPENTVLTDDARLVRWTGPAFALFSVCLWLSYHTQLLAERRIVLLLRGQRHRRRRRARHTRSSPPGRRAMTTVSILLRGCQLLCHQ